MNRNYDLNGNYVVEGKKGWFSSHKKLIGIGCGCAVLCFLAALVIGVAAWFIVPKLMNKDKPIEFVSYERTDDAVSSFGSPSGINVKIDIPQGEYPQIENAIRQMINKSRLAEELGEPTGETLQQVADNCIERFKEATSKDEYALTQFVLSIEYEYQNKECVVFHVADGVFGNGGPREYDHVVRLSDGHIMDQSEMISVSDEILKEKIVKYGDAENDEQAMMEEGYYISPCRDTATGEKACKLLWPIGSHFTGQCVIPLSEIEQFLTSEGRRLFNADGFDADVKLLPAIPEGTDETPAEEVEDPVAEDVAKGDLAAFELVGPVKECTLQIGDFKIKRSFDENGQLTKIDGKGVSSTFPGGISRDGQGRIVKAKYDPLEELQVTYKYDAQGRIAQICDQPYFDGGDITTYDYDAEGNLAYISVQYTGMDAIDPETEEETPPELNSVTILESDSHGNWTKRRLGNRTQTRTISYY